MLVKSYPLHMSFTPADGIESIELMHTDKFVTAPTMLCGSVLWPVCQNNPMHMVQNQPTLIIELMDKCA